MRVLILSDVHANPWALRAIEADAGDVDRVIFAGDAVNFGPDPAACIRWLDAHGATRVRGNHDHAVAFAVPPRSAPSKRALALVMRDWTRGQLSPEEIGWLIALPKTAAFEIAGARFSLVHGTPLDPLYDYRLQPGISEDLLEELVGSIVADFLIVGHTHLPLLRSHKSLRILNPGSAGQPLDGDPRAAYAIWRDGAIELRRVAYDQRELIVALGALPLSKSHTDDLIYILQRGRTAPQ